MKTPIYYFIMLLLLTGCKESVNDAASEISTVEPGEPVAAARMEEPANDAKAQGVAYPVQKIIKNAKLRFESEDLSATAETVYKNVKKFKAQIQYDTEGKDEYSLTRNMVVRIPSQHFEAFLGEIGKGVKYFDTKEISSEDVTEQYVDTEARIKAKKILEQRYLELIGKAKKVSEILEIEKELSAIREEIESKEGQLRYMQSRVALSTVTIEFYKTIAENPDATVSFGAKMWNAVKSGFNGISSFFIGLLYIWPFILIFVIAFIIVRKKLKKKRNGENA